jgi:hypothetical protein
MTDEAFWSHTPRMLAARAERYREMNSFTEEKPSEKKVSQKRLLEAFMNKPGVVVKPR